MWRLKRNPFKLVGFEWDLGLGNVVGTRFGPTHACPHLERRGLDIERYVTCSDGLEKGHRDLKKVVSESLKKENRRTLVIGGGRETSLGHVAGILDYCYSGEKLGILNYHSRFDMRMDESHEIMFEQMRQMCINQSVAFNYTSVGLQPFECSSPICNKEDAYAFSSYFFDEIHVSVPHIKKVVERSDYIYLSICLDVFSGSIAPGVNSPQPLGLFPHHVLPYLEFIANSGKLIGADILEYNPKYDDKNEITGRLLADLALHLVESAQEGEKMKKMSTRFY